MRSNVIKIDNRGNGFDTVMAEANKVAVYVEMEKDATIRMQLLIQEIFSMLEGILSDIEASFWIESVNGKYDLHLNTWIDLSKEQRSHLISTASSGKNEAAKTLGGKLRDMFEQAMASDVDQDYDEVPIEVLKDLPTARYELPEWDGYERSILQNIADSVKVGIVGGMVDMVISKKFA